MFWLNENAKLVFFSDICKFFAKKCCICQKKAVTLPQLSKINEDLYYKNMAANLFNRYVWLAETIHSAGRISKHEIDRKWIASPLNVDGDEEYEIRSFHRHKEAIAELFGLNIECDKIHGNEYYISNLEDVKKGSFRAWLLSHLAITNLMTENGDMRERILFDDSEPQPSLLPMVIDAMREQQTLLVTYPDASFELQPYGLRQFRYKWYVVGMSSLYPDEKEPRVFELETVEQMQVLKKKWYMPKRFDAQRFFQGYFGVNRSGRVELITIRANAAATEQLRKNPIHNSQTETECKKGFCTFEYMVSPTPEFIHELKAFGADIEVVAPATIRRSMKDETGKLAQVYGMKVHMPGEQLSLF